MFIQLCTTTAYNLADSSILVEDYAKRSKELSYPAIGISDSNLFAYPSFADACEKNGLKPIFGYQIKIKVANLQSFDGHLYIINEQGYLNLCQLVSLKQNSFDISLLEKYKEGLALIVETNPDYFSLPFLTAISKEILRLKKIFQNDFYFGIALYSSLDQEEVETLYSYCKDQEIQTIAFPKCLYLKKTDAYKTNLLIRALNKEKAEDIEKEGPYFLLSESALKSLYREEDLIKTNEFASKINFSFFEKRGKMISFAHDSQTLKEHALKGLKDRMEENQISDREKYNQRLTYELSVIEQMHFSSYFLIVEDYVSFAKNNNIKVGPGRGSAGGSLVAYALRITDVDPIRYKLTFERFLNPARITMPDIDIDFEDERRNEVVQYLKNKYGEAKVSDIVTFVKLKPRSCLNLIGPALNFNEARLKRLTSSIDEKSEDFNDALNKDRNNEFHNLYQDPYYKEICDLAATLLNVPINTSIHAAGIILSEDPIYLTVPRKEGTSSTCLYEYPYMERLGFLKVDILALTNLSFIKKVEKKIKENHKELINIQDHLNEKEVFDVLQKKDLVQIFQLNTSYGMKETIDLVKPTCFNDIAALIALYRPGPMKYIENYARRKHGQEKIVYADERLKPILQDTYGIFVYQEQVIQAVSILASFSLGEADLFRRAISKKDISKMETYKEKFLSGCVNNGINKENAQQIFLDIERFAEYGFNKAHAYSYSFIVYTLLYYKTFYRDEFYLTALECESFSSLKCNDILKELKERKIKVRNPSLNESSLSEYRKIENNIYLPLKNVSNTRTNILEGIIKEREKGAYLSFYDFAMRTNVFIKEEDEKTILSLIDSGAFDHFCKSRLAMKEKLHDYLGFAHFKMKEDQLPPLTDEGEDIGEMLYLEKMAIGKVLSCHFYQLFSKNNYSTYLVSDTSSLEMYQTVMIESEERNYKIKVKKNSDLSKFDFILIEGFLPYKKRTVEVNSYINCHRKVIKHG